MSSAILDKQGIAGLGEVLCGFISWTRYGGHDGQRGSPWKRVTKGALMRLRQATAGFLSLQNKKGDKTDNLQNLTSIFLKFLFCVHVRSYLFKTPELCALSGFSFSNKTTNGVIHSMYKINYLVDDHLHMVSSLSFVCLDLLPLTLPSC